MQIHIKTTQLKSSTMATSKNFFAVNNFVATRASCSLCFRDNVVLTCSHKRRPIYNMGQNWKCWLCNLRLCVACGDAYEGQIDILTCTDKSKAKNSEVESNHNQRPKLGHNFLPTVSATWLDNRQITED